MFAMMVAVGNALGIVAFGSGLNESAVPTGRVDAVQAVITAG